MYLCVQILSDAYDRISVRLGSGHDLCAGCFCDEIYHGHQFFLYDLHLSAGFCRHHYDEPQKVVSVDPEIAPCDGVSDVSAGRCLGCCARDGGRARFTGTAAGQNDSVFSE